MVPLGQPALGNGDALIERRPVHDVVVRLIDALSRIGIVDPRGPRTGHGIGRGLETGDDHVVAVGVVVVDVRATLVDAVFPRAFQSVANTDGACRTLLGVPDASRYWTV